MNQNSIKKTIDTIIQLPIFWLFSGFLIIHGGDKKIIPLIIISIIISVSYYRWDNIRENYKSPYIIVIAISAIFGTILYETIGFGSGEVRTYIALSLYLLIIPKGIISNKKIIYLLFFSALLSTTMLIYNRYELGIIRGVNTFNPIPYSTTLSIYAISSLYFYLSQKSKISIITYFLFLIGIIITETRSSIFSLIVVSSMLFFVMKMKYQRFKPKHIPIMISSVLSILILFNMLGDRVHYTLIEIKRISNGDMNSSIGLRLQFWDAASQLYVLSPLYGLGDSHKTELRKLNDNGQISNRVIQYSPAHYHNQYIDKLVKTGAIGLLLLLLIQLVPCFIAKSRKSPHRVLIYSITTGVTLLGLTDTPMSQPFSLFPILILTHFILGLNGSDLRHGIVLKPPLP